MDERESLIRKLRALLRVALRLRYFSLDVEGAGRIPREGPLVFVQNHAGWFALDSILVGGVVGDVLGIARTPYYAVEEAALDAPILGSFFRRLGGLPAHAFRHPERLPPQIDSFGICPEGVHGNCKPFWEAYRMREWSRTFVKLALQRHAKIVPVAVFGGEESLPSLWTVRLLEPFIGSVVGLPLLPFPLPARWKIVFHEPVEVEPQDAHHQRDYCLEVSGRVRDIVQRTLDREAPRRPLLRLSSLVARAT